VAYLDDALRELARVARFALIYVPSTGRPMGFEFLSPGFRGLRWSFVVDVYNCSGGRIRIGRYLPPGTTMGGWPTRLFPSQSGAALAQPFQNTQAVQESWTGC